MSIVDSVAGRLKLIGEHLCLDFTNTVDNHASDHPEEYLTTYAELVAWSWHAGTITENEAKHLLAEAAKYPDEAATALEAAIRLRETLFHIFLATMEGKKPSASDLASFNDARAEALAYSEIVVTDDGFAWHWIVSGQQLDWPLWPVIASAADLLLSPDLKLVKKCPGPDCGWLFLDTSKNHTRRWCTMEGCGNRAKARRNYQRKRQSQQTGA